MKKYFKDIKSKCEERMTVTGNTECKIQRRLISGLGACLCRAENCSRLQGMKRICDHARDVLRETDNPAVGYGDAGLLHLIAERAGVPHNGPKTEARILNALSKTPGVFAIRYFKTRRGVGRVFRLPKHLQHSPTVPEKGSE